MQKKIDHFIKTLYVCDSGVILLPLNVLQKRKLVLLVAAFLAYTGTVYKGRGKRMKNMLNPIIDLNLKKNNRLKQSEGLCEASMKCFSGL